MMKRTNLLFSSLLVLGFLAFINNACKKDSNNVAPIISLTTSSVKDSSIIIAGDSAKIQFTIATPNQLALVEIKNTLGNIIQQFSDSDSKKIFTYSYKSIAGTEIYTIEVTDKIGFTTTKVCTVFTKPKIATAQFSTVTDQAGNVYRAITIESQTWMAENLRTTKYNDGTTITQVAADTLWAVSDTSNVASLCFYDNTTNADTIARYGVLYNWAVVASGKLCPEGWHVSTNDEWNTLLTTLTNNGYGMNGTGNDIAKALATSTGWETSQQSGEIGNDATMNNSTRFSATAGGFRNVDGSYSRRGKTASWWTATAFHTQFAYSWNVNAYSSKLSSNMNYKQMGLSVRCLKN